MAVNAVSDASAAISSYTANNSGTNALGQEDFLTLLVAQLEHQDPLEPQSNTEFIAQLATFSTVEQQTLTNDKLDQVLATSADLERSAAFQLLDQQVVVQTDSFYLDGDEIDLGVVLAEDAEGVTLNVKNEDGEVVASFELTDVDAASETYIGWDGCDANGQPLPSGAYQIELEARGADGDIDQALALVKTRVTEVGMGSNGSLLVTDAGDVTLDGLYSVGAYESGADDGRGWPGGGAVFAPFAPADGSAQSGLQRPRTGAHSTGLAHLGCQGEPDGGGAARWRGAGGQRGGEHRGDGG